MMKKLLFVLAFLPKLAFAQEPIPITDLETHSHALPHNIPLDLCPNGEKIKGDIIWTGLVNKDCVILESGRLRIAAPFEGTIRTLVTYEGTTLTLDSKMIGRNIDCPCMPGASEWGTIKLKFNDAVIDTKLDPEQWGHSLLIMGDLVIIGKPKTRYIRLSKNPSLGDTSLELSSAPLGWEVNDAVVIPGTRQERVRKDVKPLYENERMIIDSIEGNIVRLKEPLKFDHHGPFTPHLVNLSNNITFESINPSGTRAHFAVTGKGSANIAYATFLNMGRTVNSRDWNNTAFDEEGVVVRIGTNQQGRYPVHLHHTLGKIIIDGVVVEGSPYWGIAIHNSHYGEYRNIAVYDVQGAGIITEQGNESYNIIEDSIVGYVHTGRATDRGGVRDNPIRFGNDSSCFWFRGPHNYFRRSIAFNCEFSGVNYNGYYMKASRIPIKPGSDTNVTGEFYVSPSTKFPVMTVLESSDIEIYGTAVYGFWNSWPPGLFLTQKDYNIFKNYRIWHTRHCNITYHTAKQEYNNWTCISDHTVVNEGTNRFTWGFHFENYENLGIRILNSQIEGYDVGLIMPRAADANVLIENVILRNQINVIDYMGGNVKTSTYRNVTSEPIPKNTKNVAKGHISLSTSRDGIRAMNLTQIFVENSFGLTSARLFWPEQAPDFIVPRSTNANNGVPEEGLTNTQARAKYGLSWLGEIATCDMRVPLINNAFVCGK